MYWENKHFVTPLITVLALLWWPGAKPSIQECLYLLFLKYIYHSLTVW